MVIPEAYGDIAEDTYFVLGETGWVGERNKKREIYH